MNFVHIPKSGSGPQRNTLKVLQCDRNSRSRPNKVTFAMTKEERGIRRDKEKRARQLKVVIKGEVTTVLVLVLLGAILLLLLGGGHDTSLLVISDTLLEEVGLAAEGDVLHEVEGVGGLVDLLIAEGDKETISDELNVLLHEVGVHAEKRARKSLSKELLLIYDNLGDDLLDDLLTRAVLQVRVKETGKVGVQTLVARDELVGEGKTRHETTLLQPEDGGESTREKDTLNSSKGDEALTKGRVLVVDPLESPVGLLANAWDGVNGVEEVLALRLLLDVGVDEERVGLGVNVLHHNLETVEAASLWDLNLSAEALNEVLVDDTI